MSRHRHRRPAPAAVRHEIGPAIHDTFSLSDAPPVVAATPTLPVSPPVVAPTDQHPDALALAQVETDLNRLSGILEDAQDRQEEEEQEEADRARTPLSLHFELLSCQYAAEHFKPDQIVPDYEFSHPCPFGKASPDQDCRGCAFHKVIRVGSNLDLHQKRYPQYGAVFPVPMKQANPVAQMLDALGIKAARRPGHEIFWLQQQKDLGARRQQEIAAREAERQQRGQL